MEIKNFEVVIEMVEEIMEILIIMELSVFCLIMICVIRILVISEIMVDVIRSKVGNYRNVGNTSGY